MNNITLTRLLRFTSFHDALNEEEQRGLDHKIDRWARILQGKSKISLPEARKQAKEIFMALVE